MRSFSQLYVIPVNVSLKMISKLADDFEYHKTMKIYLFPVKLQLTDNKCEVTLHNKSAELDTMMVNGIIKIITKMWSLQYFLLCPNNTVS